jgi:hypothetical protein
LGLRWSRACIGISFIQAGEPCEWILGMVHGAVYGKIMVETYGGGHASLSVEGRTVEVNVQRK